MRRQTLLSALLLHLLVAERARAAFSSGDTGTSTAQFLSLGIGAREAAMGEAATASSRGPDSLFYNPAGMVETARSAFSFMYSSYLVDTSFQYAGYVQKLGYQGAVGVALRRFDAGDITTRDTAGAASGSVHPQDLAITLGYAHWLIGEWWGPLSGSSAGVTLHYVRSALSETQTALSGGFGVQSPWYFDHRFKLGLSVDNLFGSMTFDQASDPLPTVMRVGAAYRPGPGWELTADADFPRDGSPFVGLGIEGGTGILLLRGGYNSEASTGLNGLAGVSGGIGLVINDVTLDYAIVPFGDLGQAHRVSLTLKF